MGRSSGRSCWATSEQHLEVALQPRPPEGRRLSPSWASLGQSGGSSLQSSLGLGSAACWFFKSNWCCFPSQATSLLSLKKTGREDSWVLRSSTHPFLLFGQISCQ